MQISPQQLAISLAAVAGAYLCGSIPFGLLIGKLKGVDIRKQGSGNIGATNVGRVLGRPWGILAFLLDVSKGLVPVLLFGIAVRQWMTSGPASPVNVHLLWAAVATTTVVGHLFPVFLGFKGGKGVATSLGALLGIYPYFTVPGLLAFGLWVVLTLTTRYVSVGSIGAAGAFPIIFAVLAAVRRKQWGTVAELWPFYVMAVAMACLVIYRHRGNIQRLMRGSENRIGSSTAARS